MVTRRYGFICGGELCYYHASGKRHRCTDCSARLIATERDEAAWQHAVYMLDLRLNKQEKQKHG